MKKLNQRDVIAIIIVLIVVGFSIYYSVQKKPVVCTEDARLCSDGTSVVRIPPDCEFEACPDVDENKNYCAPESRQADACITLYEPVCGYPEEETYSNSCFACMEEEVEYWVDGDCE